MDDPRGRPRRICSRLLRAQTAPPRRRGQAAGPTRSAGARPAAAAAGPPGCLRAPRPLPGRRGPAGHARARPPTRPRNGRPAFPLPPPCCAGSVDCAPARPLPPLCSASGGNHSPHNPLGQRACGCDCGDSRVKPRWRRQCRGAAHLRRPARDLRVSVCLVRHGVRRCCRNRRDNNRARGLRAHAGDAPVVPASKRRAWRPASACPPPRASVAAQRRLRLRSPADGDTAASTR